MSEPSHRHDHLSLLTDTIGLPRPQGWAAPAVRWLTVWFVGNIGLIVGVPAPELRSLEVLAGGEVVIENQSRGVEVEGADSLKSSS